LRLYTAHGPDWRDYTGGAKITEIRVHTDAGFVDVALDGDPQHAYVVFSEPVQTRTVTVETRQSKPGKRGAEIVIAEVEAFGESGPRRPPLDLDPARSFVTYETQPWKPRGQDDHIVRIVFVEVLSADGKPIRIARGSALLGRKGDRFLLVERLSTAGCDAPRGSWALLDQHTRMLLPLGTMGGVPATVRVLPSGDGLAFEHPAAMPHAVVIEDGEPKLQRPRKRDTDPVALLAKWGFAEAPTLRRGGFRLPELPTGCEPATSKAEVLAAALGREAKPADPADFFVCRLTDTTSAILGSRGECGGDWSLAVVGPDFTSTKHNRKHARNPTDARGIRVAPIDGGLLVEVSKEAGASANLYVLGERLVELAKGAGLAVHAPAVCDPCDDRFDRSAPLPVGGAVVADPTLVDEPATPTDPADATPEDELPGVDAPEDDEPAEPDAAEPDAGAPTEDEAGAGAATERP
jgi:hypothetical protein